MKEEFQFDDRMDFVKFGMWIGKTIILLQQVSDEIEMDEVTEETFKKIKKSIEYLSIE